jgi:RNA polymerase sigma factor (sigma-70 family)
MRMSGDAAEELRLSERLVILDDRTALRTHVVDTMADAHDALTREELITRTAKSHAPALEGFLRARLGSTDEVNDVLQKAMVKALARSATLHEPAKVVPWLYRILRHTLIDHRRAARARDAHVIAVDVLPDKSDETAPTDDICACSLRQLEALQPTYASILRRVVFDGASLQEVADELHISVNSATVRLSRARQALRNRLQQHCGVASLDACLRCVCEERGCCN